MKTIDLKPVGTVHVSMPNLAVALDLVSMWGSNPSQAHIGRLCAAAIGVSCTNLGLPKYRLHDADPIAFGGKCLARLLAKDVWAGDIYTAGAQLMVFFADNLPKQKEVEEVVNFTKSEGGAG